ncbi:DUF72 domain-containing protein [Marinobacter salexigens]|uniref:DUF72 domain-containing protein n=1 Tax=Marinobacter salexigens TaxID=1925763 RepID=A0ABS6A5M0_9GAMM|nr:DUF72 domain-containing protein [Marinobacter salexigens]MBU2873495.1 DUF72 domain-containing protein [Marinobacter salexigens]
MALPYFLGCPQWQHPAWGNLLPLGESPLGRYSQVFNCVEGNTTFYATPSQEQCRQWRAQVPDDFRFLLKFPRHITHDRLLSGVDASVRNFLDIVAPLEDVLGPFLLQLPAAFGPRHLHNLWDFIDALPAPLECAVEVRHNAFFSKGDAEKALNRGLRERRVARVCMDTRALFSATPDKDVTIEAQRKKPRVPVHLLPGDAAPVIRYIGHPDLESNRRYLAPWVERVATWVEEGRRPYFFLHMPDIGDALALTEIWTSLISERVDQLEALRFSEKQPQMGLF